MAVKIRIFNAKLSIDEMKMISILPDFNVAELKYEIETRLSIRTEHQKRLTIPSSVVSDNKEEAISATPTTLDDEDMKLSKFTLTQNSVITCELSDDSDWNSAQIAIDVKPSATQPSKPPKPPSPPNTSIELRGLTRKESVYSHDAQLVLSKTMNTMNWVVISGLCSSFSHSSRLAILYLYAREFDDATEQGIAWVLWAGTLSLGLAGLFYPCLADVIGYDLAIMIKLIIRCIGIFGECISMNFIFLSVFYVVSQVAITAVSLAYIAWILPHDTAVKYTSYFFCGYALFYLAGPIISGILSHFMSYRGVFWLNLILNIIMLILAFIFISNKQRKLETEQLALKDEFESANTDEKYRFPIVNHMNADRADFAVFWSSLSCFEWFQLINVVLQISLTMSVEILVVSYYAVFIVDHFGGNVITATLQVCFVALGFAIGSALAPAVIGNQKLMHPFNTASFIIIESSVIMIILLIVLFPMITNRNLFWIISIAIGLFLGMTVMTQESLILKHQLTNSTRRENCRNKRSRKKRNSCNCCVSRWISIFAKHQICICLCFWCMFLCCIMFINNIFNMQERRGRSKQAFPIME
eukprot:674522_1